MQVFKKCLNDDCGEEHYTDSDKCTKCNTIYGASPKGTSGVITVTSKNTEPEKPEFTEPPEFCTDCVKTKGFSITIACVAFAIIVAATAILGTHEVKWYAYWLFWGFWITVTGLVLYASMLCIKDYCTKNTRDYKDGFTIFMFGLFLTMSSIAILVIIATMPDNFVWVDTIWMK